MYMGVQQFQQRNIEQDGFTVSAVSPYCSKNARLSNADAHLLLRSYGLSRVFVPDTTRSTAVVTDAPVGRFTPVNQFPNISIAGAEAAFGSLWNGYATWVGGCLTLVALGGPHILFGHAGRDSLLDRSRIAGNTAGVRRYESIVFSIADAFAKRGVRAADISLFGFFGIAPELFDHPFEHPEYGEFNRKMVAYTNARWPGSFKGTHLNLGRLVQAQAREAGFAQGLCVGEIHESETFPTTRHPTRSQDRYLVFAHRTR